VKSLRYTNTGDVETVSPLHHKILLHKACKKCLSCQKQSRTHIFMDFKENRGVLKIQWPLH